MPSMFKLYLGIDTCDSVSDINRAPNKSTKETVFTT